MDGDALGALGWIDAGALFVVGLALARGLWIGMIREAFSLAALASACIAVRFGTAPFADWLLAQAPIALAPLAATLFSGVAIGILTLVVVGRVGTALRRGVHAAGLGFADRLAGGALGAAEGALVVALFMLLISTVLGSDHPSVRDTHTLAALDVVAEGLRGKTPDVAAPFEPEAS